MIFDEAKLNVETDVLIDMSRRVMRLSTKNGTNLVDPLEHADHHLLVKLWRLREVRGLAEIIDGENIRTALGRRRDQLGRLNFGESFAIQEFAERCHHAGSKSNQRASAWMTQT